MTQLNVTRSEQAEREYTEGCWQRESRRQAKRRTRLMTYTLNFVGKFGLWELTINKFRTRFYWTRDGAMKTVTRYRRMLQSESDRYDKMERAQ